MDPVTTAIAAGVAAGVASGATKTAEQAIVDAYNGLKALLKKKFGAQSEIVAATENLERKPDSAGRKGTLAEEVAAAKADQDQEIVKAAEALLELVKALPGGEQHVQTAIGSHIAQADRGSTATVSVNKPGEK